MSDRPKNPTSSPPDDPQSSSGWHQPDQPGTPRPASKPTTAQSGWRVPTLPTDLGHAPRSEGAWHLPAPEDTTFDESDQTEIAPERVEVIQQVARPEDMILVPESDVDRDTQPETGLTGAMPL